MKAYSKYKNCGVQWIGKVPEHWVVSRLKYFCEPLKSGGTPKSDDSRFYAAEGTPWVAIADMSSTPLVIDTAKHLTEEGIADKNLNIFPSGTILYSIYATLGKVSELAVPACINQAILAINPDKRYCKTYFKYCLTAQEQYVYSLSNGNTQNNLNAEKVANFLLFLPPIIEQQAIASFLDAKMKPIDDIIAKREKQIELLEEMKSAIISRAVTKGLNPDAQMKDSGIEGVDVIPEHWNKTRFVYSSWIRSRLGWRALKADEYKDSGYPFLSAYNIVDNKLVWDDFNYISQERFDESPEIKLNIGDILLVKDGAGLGKCARVDELPEGPSTVNGSLAVITPHEGLSYKYLYYYLLGNTFKQMIDLLRNGMGVPHFTQGNMRTIYLPLPPLGEQEQIVTYLDSTIVKLDVRIAKRRKQIELLQEYKQALITAAVTGKIDVREHIS